MTFQMCSSNLRCHPGYADLFQCMKQVAETIVYSFSLLQSRQRRVPMLMVGYMLGIPEACFMTPGAATSKATDAYRQDVSACLKRPPDVARASSHREHHTAARCAPASGALWRYARPFERGASHSTSLKNVGSRQFSAGPGDWDMCRTGGLGYDGCAGRPARAPHWFRNACPAAKWRLYSLKISNCCWKPFK